MVARQGMVLQGLRNSQHILPVIDSDVRLRQFDSVLEFLLLSGRSLAEAYDDDPRSWQSDRNMAQAKDFMGLLGPDGAWDGQLV